MIRVTSSQQLIWCFVRCNEIHNCDPVYYIELVIVNKFKCVLTKIYSTNWLINVIKPVLSIIDLKIFINYFTLVRKIISFSISLGISVIIVSLACTVYKSYLLWNHKVFVKTEKNEFLSYHPLDFEVHFFTSL